MSLTNRTLPHHWAHKTKPSGHTSNSNMFFEGDRIYSYGHHFLIATHVTNTRGENAVLFTTATYSVTTQGHKSRVRQSIPSSLPVFSVDLTGFREVSPANGPLTATQHSKRQPAAGANTPNDGTQGPARSSQPTAQARTHRVF